MRFAHFGLFAADDDELLVLSLPQANTNWQVQTHGPEFNVARPASVHGVDGEVHEAEDVDNQDRQKHEADLSHFDNGVVTLEPEIEACSVQKDGVDNNEGKQRNAITIQVCGSKVEAPRVGVYHDYEDDRNLTG